MKLKILNIVITSREDFLGEVKKSLFSNDSSKDQNNTIHFDSIETVKKILTANKIEILMAVARLRPESINQLAKILDREFPHVLKDCRTLEVQGFIKLEQAEGTRKQLIPTLTRDYDIIRVKSKIEEIFPISAKSNKVLLSSY